MKKRIIWKDIKRDNESIVKMPFKTCERCNKEFNNGNVFASKYCTECSEDIKREKARERVRQFRQKNKEGDSNI